MDDLLREFLAEAEDLIEALFRDIEALRERGAPARVRRELMGRIFRHVHTLKGTAASAGLTVASQTAHEFETLLDCVRAGRVTLDDSVLDAFDDAAHALSQTLDAAARGDAPSLPLQLLQNLRSLTSNGGDDNDSQHPSHPASTATILPEEIARTLSADEARRVHEAVAEGQSLFVFHVTFDLETFDQSFRELSAQLGERGELLSTLPGLTEAISGAISLRLLYASDAGREELSALASAFASVLVEKLKPATQSVKEKADGEFDEEAGVNVAHAEAIAPLPTQVRVELGQLDALISATHELMADTVAAFELAVEGAAAQDERRSLAEARAADIHERFIRLEEQLIGLRRVPLARTLERAARAGSQAARATGKEVAFEIEGGDVRLDKSLVEAISDPLLHLVRNAVDHGIESPERRASAGKSRQGLVRLEVAAENDRVILKITDDGRGIDVESIARAAARQGIIEAGQSMSRHQALRLIFRPGFSTAAAVSQMSGRGVGLDVVERAIEQVGGEMRVWSEAKLGTTFEMIVPVGLALMSARVVSSGGFSYCVDARCVAEICVVRAEDVRRESEGELIERDGMRLPLVRLRKLLGQPAIEDAESWPIIIVTTKMKEIGKGAGDDARGARVAVVVDECIEERTEVLVRRLGAHVLRWHGVSGAAELSDGGLALVLDLPRLIETQGSVG